MHVWFRQYAQQMGMQNVRAILPEQIDLLINTSIHDVVDEIIKTHVGATNDRIVTDNSKIGSINDLRTLYTDGNVYFTTSGVSIPDTDFALSLDNARSEQGKFNCPKFISFDKTEDDNYQIEALMLIDLSIEYLKGEKLTSLYPIRIIEPMYLADTLQDFVLAPRVRTPIATILNNGLSVYLGENYTSGNGILKNTTLIPYDVVVHYIRRPAKVKYASDLANSTENVHCDLPDSLHVPILKHAVDLYRISIAGSLYNAQQQQRQQNQETSRNAARPDNEGYQS